mgnify:CR=1 FL=1
MHAGEGTVIGGRYRIVAPLGAGGMGSVYLAEDLRLGRKRRAVKFAWPLPGEHDAFVREAKVLCRLRHPLLPEIVDYFPPEQHGLPACIVMEYVEGETLAERFVRCGRRLPFPRVLRWLVQLADVLAYLHAQRPPVVFRDLKPSNIVIDAADRAVLVDFGIARSHRPDTPSDTVRFGTPGFAAPEQLRGGPSGPKADLYALGALAYYLLSGGDRAARRGAGWPAKLRAAGVPAEFVALLERLLADDPADRPHGAEEVRAALSAFAVAAGDSALPDAAASASVAPRIAAVLPAYPGAGATFAVFSLSAALSRRGWAHAVVECPGTGPEHYELLHGAKRMPRRAVFAPVGGAGPAGPAWRRGPAAYFPLRPDAPPVPEPEPPFFHWLRQLDVPLVLLDGSGAGDAPSRAAQLAARADELLIVADCTPSKWNDRRRDALRAAVGIATEKGVPVNWVGNRDQPFGSRRSWLELFPVPPAVLLPQFPPHEVADAVWKGTVVPAAAPHAEAMDRAWRSLLDRWASLFPAMDAPDAASMLQ